MSKQRSVLHQTGSGCTKLFYVYVRFLDFHKANQKEIHLLYPLVKKQLLAHSHLEK